MIRKINHCDGCGIKEGGKQFQEVLSEYRGHNLCSRCQARWPKQEKMLERAIKFEEFLRGIDNWREQYSQRLQLRNEEIRKQKGRSPEELAQSFNLSERTIYRILR